LKVITNLTMVFLFVALRIDVHFPAGAKAPGLIKMRLRIRRYTRFLMPKTTGPDGIMRPGR